MPRKQYDSNPRYKGENVYAMDLDMPEKTTQEFAGPGMKSRVDQVLGMDLNGDDGDDVTFSSADHAISSPYLTYGNELGTANGGNNMDRERATDDRSTRGDKARPKTGKKKESGKSSSSAQQAQGYDNYNAGPATAGYGGSSAGGGGGTASRPKSATRRRESEASSGAYREQDSYRSSNNSASRYVQDEEQYPTARGLIKK